MFTAFYAVNIFLCGKHFLKIMFTAFYAVNIFLNNVYGIYVVNIF